MTLQTKPMILKIKVNRKKRKEKAARLIIIIKITLKEQTENDPGIKQFPAEAKMEVINAFWQG